MKLWGQVEHKPQISTPNIFDDEKIQQIFLNFRFHFDHVALLREKSNFEVFF